MNSKRVFSSMLFIFSFNFHTCLSMDWFTACRTSLFSCGHILDVDFPFCGNGRPDLCGHPKLKLGCEDNLTTTIEIMSVKYHVLEINQTAQILKIARSDFFSDGICSPDYGNTALDSNLFDYAPGSGDITIFYDCKKNYSYFSDRYFSCPSGSTYKEGYVLMEARVAYETGICNYSLTVGVPRSYYKAIGNWTMMERALSTDGFEVKYNSDSASCDQCTKFGGACGYNWTSSQMACYCQNLSSALGACSPTPAAATAQSDHKTGTSLKRILAIGIPATLSGIMIIVVAIIACWRKLKRRNEFDVDSFIKNNQLFAPRRYDYSHLKKMTNSFAQKIGQGGYGTVYKGKLADGHEVAIKVLSELHGNGEEFVNEVTSMGQTSHVNIVGLLGFCYEKSKRALIYDFMPNGSLDKFIFSEASSNTNPRLEWRVLSDIAVGVARGLEYLHRGCKTRILHFDIKPQNILLDKDFCPKIADFGLAKLWLKDDSITSIMGARGTAGYIAPEVISRSYGGVSHKSDVYSYGMLVLEMVGGRKKYESAASNTSEIYYQYWIYKELEAGEVTSILEIESDEEKEILRKMILVSFWCIQTNPEDRPSMTDVVEMMEGSLESIEIPPKPFFFSPGKTPHEQSTTSMSNPQQAGHHEHGNPKSTFAIPTVAGF